MQEQEYPWLFRRDEVDLLEDELEDLYEKHHQCTSTNITQEATVLLEQMRTQEESDLLLSERLGLDGLEDDGWLDERREQTASWMISAHTPELDRQVMHTHPLYRQAKRWVERVKPMAKQQYERGGAFAAAFFRVYANVNLVPLKIITALTEEGHEDHMGWIIAQEEYRLSLIYLDRIQTSLSLMVFETELSEWIVSSHAGAQALRAQLLRHVEDLQRKTGV